MNNLIPDSLNFGAGELYEVSYLEQILGITRRTAFKYLSALRIKPFYIGKKVYYSHQTFCRIMFVLSKPNSPGFCFPGSAKKTDSRSTDLLSEVTDGILTEAADPRILAEMNACGGSNPQILKQFISRPVGRPPKEKNEN